MSTSQLESLKDDEALISLVAWNDANKDHKIRYITLKGDNGNVVANGEYTRAPVRPKP